MRRCFFSAAHPSVHEALYLRDAGVLLLQAEQFANELTRHLGIAAPDCRIVRQVRQNTCAETGEGVRRHVVVVMCVCPR
jgi:hypothetical protein